MNMDQDIINNLVSKSQLVFSFEEGIIYFLILNSIEPANITSPDNKSSNIIVLTEHIQSNHDTDVIPLDEVDEYSQHIYIISLWNKIDIPELKENKYYPWVNQYKFWITEQLLTKVNISHKVANKLFNFMSEYRKEIKNIHI